MTKKQYKACRITIIILLSFSISFAINLNNYYLPVVFMASAMAGMYYCRKQLETKDILVDERDYKLAGDAARYAITIYAFVGAVGTFVLMGISGKSGRIYDLSQYLAYSVCLLMLMNAFIFRYLNKRGK